MVVNTGLNVDLKQAPKIVDDQFISILTSLFIEGLAIDQHKKQEGINWAVQHHQRGPNNAPLQFKSQPGVAQIKSYCARKAEPQNSNRKSQHGDLATTTRTFILGLSDAFNNLLMGIWGNLSLVNMTIDQSNPVFQRVGLMEILIQNGSAFMNGILGYLSERRVVAKNIRLDQLIQELTEYIPMDTHRIKQEIIQASLAGSVGHNYLTVIAAGLVKILEQLIGPIQKHYDQIMEEKIWLKGLDKRLLTIERLMGNVWEIIRQLKFYAGQHVYDSQKISVKAMVQGEVRQIRKRYAHLSVSLDMPPRLPRIYADRSMLKFVLNQLLKNAAHAMPDHGRLCIDIRTLNTEVPQSRCVARRWCDSLVVTVSDTGHGMDLDTLLRIFEPFYVGERNANRLGLGLAASWGIIKTHGGYIHVRSQPGKGSTFKVYLPLK